MKQKRTHTRTELKTYRKNLRSNLTPAEAFLWKHLKSKQLDDKRFTKQHSIGNYIVDFYCASQKLIVELDGEVHNNPTSQENDTKRTDYLNELGYDVIRYENKMVFDQLSTVLKEIKNNFKSKK